MSYAGIFTDKNNTDHPVTSALYGTCDTAATTAAKVVTCADVDVLTSGMTIRVKFTNANTAASPTINVNSTGAKTVYRFGTTAPVDGDSWKAGEVVELLYDGTYFYMVSADDIGGVYAALADKADNDIIAAEFDSTANYVVGNYCIYQGGLYKFKANHTGAWAAADVDAITIAGELTAKQPKTDNNLTTTSKDTTGAINELKSGLTNKANYQYYNKESSASEDDAIKDLYDSINIYDTTIVGTLNYHGFWMFMALKYTGGSYGSIVLFRFDQTAKFLSVYDGTKTIRSFTFGS